MRERNRREASTHAKVYRALMNPYETLEAEYRGPVVEKKNHPSKPSEEWRSAFLEKFKQTRFVRFSPYPPFFSQLFSLFHCSES